MVDLSVKTMGMTFKNPLISASGTYGFGKEYNEFYNIELLGGISTKGLTLEKRTGNKGTRIHETPSGIMNSIGLENPGVESYINNESQFLKDKDVKILLNLGGSNLESYVKAAELLDEANSKERIYDVVELNISCPNVKLGGMAYGMKPEDAGYITKEIVAISKAPVVVKLTPNAPDLVAVAKSVETSGAAGVSLVNTFSALDIDVENRRPIFNNVTAGLSGPCIMPIALKMVRDVSNAVSIPVIGMGGISTHIDVLKFIMAGATLVQVGTANFLRPTIMPEIIENLESYMTEMGISCFDEIRGIV